MSNPTGNPDIATHGRQTRFGAASGPDPKSAQQRAARPWSIRLAMRRLAAARLDIDQPITLARLHRLLSRPGATLSGAELIACEMFLLALQGNADALCRVTLMIDGPLRPTLRQNGRPDLVHLL